jgi:hypothetical protein
MSTTHPKSGKDAAKKPTPAPSKLPAKSTDSELVDDLQAALAMYDAANPKSAKDNAKYWESVTKTPRGPKTAAAIAKKQGLPLSAQITMSLAAGMMGTCRGTRPECGEGAIGTKCPHCRGYRT